VILRKIVFVFFCCSGFISRTQTNLLEKAESFDIIDSSIIYAERFIKESYAQKDTVAIIKGGVFLSKQYFLKAKYKEIEIVINQTLPLAVLKKDLTQQASLKLLLAAAYNFGGDNKKALKLYLQVSELYEKLNNPAGIIRCANNMAEFYRKVREYDEALKCIRKGFDVYQKQNMNDIIILVALTNRMAAIMMETNAIDSAIFYSNKAIVLCQKSNNKGGEAISLNEKGQAYKSIGRIDSAIFCFRKAEDLWRSTGADSDVLRVMNNRALLYFEYHYPNDLIIQTCLSIINNARQKKIDFSLEDTYNLLSKTYLKVGDTISAFVYQQKYY
jgi:tetratricopeptide (TPR) repeat protein